MLRLYASQGDKTAAMEVHSECSSLKIWEGDDDGYVCMSAMKKYCDYPRSKGKDDWWTGEPMNQWTNGMMAMNEGKIGNKKARDEAVQKKEDWSSMIFIGIQPSQLWIAMGIRRYVYNQRIPPCNGLKLDSVDFMCVR